MAFVGALIVFSGLVVLSLVISQLHKVLMFFEKKPVDFQQDRETPSVEQPEDKPGLLLPKQFPSDINEIVRLYKPLVEALGETFYLSKLYEILRKNNFPHPHITLTALRESEILIPDGDGVFTWNPPTEHDDNEKVEG
ncbi:MAG: OadG family protein [Deltaproteobacteria bacterium]|nr:OadG family protein [Deltaproteobacteria bacterium]